MTRLTVLLVALLLVASAASVLRSPITTAAQTPVDPAAQLQAVVDAINRGDLEGLLTFFTDDSVIKGAPDCSTSCTGLDGIRREFQAVVAANVHVTLTDVVVNGSSASSRFEATSNVLTQLGFDRIVGSFTIELRGDKIAVSRFDLDSTDAETARFLSMYPGLTTSPPPTPQTVEPGQTEQPQLPDTGGEPSGGGADWTALAALLGLFGLVAVVGGLGAVGRSIAR